MWNNNKTQISFLGYVFFLLVDMCFFSWWIHVWFVWSNRISSNIVQITAITSFAREHSFCKQKTIDSRPWTFLHVELTECGCDACTMHNLPKTLNVRHCTMWWHVHHGWADVASNSEIENGIHFRHSKHFKLWCAYRLYDKWLKSKSSCVKEDIIYLQRDIDTITMKKTILGKTTHYFSF